MQAEARLAFSLGGRTAEEIVFGEVTTGATDDLERATELARRMVTQWGMSSKLGPRTFGKKEELGLPRSRYQRNPELQRGDRSAD